MAELLQFSFSLEQQEDYAFLIRFDNDVQSLLTDEPPPLGKGEGPNPARLLAASVANCLSASLLFSLRKYKNQPGQMVTTVSAQMERNASGRMRIGEVDVVIQVDSPAESLTHLDRVLEHPSSTVKRVSD